MFTNEMKCLFEIRGNIAAQQPQCTRKESAKVDGGSRKHQKTTTRTQPQRNHPENRKKTETPGTVPDDSDDPGACSENAAPEKTTPNQARAVQHINSTERPYTPIATQNSISYDNDSCDAGSENKSLRKNNPKSGKDSAAGHLEGKT